MIRTSDQTEAEEHKPLGCIQRQVPLDQPRRHSDREIPTRISMTHSLILFRR